MFPSATLIAALNHLLEGQPWVRERLVPFAGRSVRLEIPPLDLHLLIAADGALRAAATPDAADATIQLSALRALRLLVARQAPGQGVKVNGDEALAAALHGVFRELRWDIEEDLSRVVGDVAARRLVGWGEALRAWQREAAGSFAGSVGEYLVEERSILAGKGDVAHWVQEVDRLRDDVERLQKRIDRRIPKTPDG
jgi:ubiquinone biosynthesis protein UbiJ